MKEGGAANLKMAASYRDLLVNRGAYTVQSYVPDAGGKYYYYRPRDQRRLTLETIRDHLNGLITVGLYAIDPRSQCSKWLAVDADYATALNDLLKLRSDFSVFRASRGDSADIPLLSAPSAPKASAAGTLRDFRNRRRERPSIRTMIIPPGGTVTSVAAVSPRFVGARHGVPLPEALKGGQW